jgi:hypothetical protein
MSDKTTTPEPIWSDKHIEDLSRKMSMEPAESDNHRGVRYGLTQARAFYEGRHSPLKARIQELEDQVKALRDAQSKPIQGEVDRWISVANELPPIHEDDREDGFVLLLMLCASWKPDTWKTIKGSRVFGDYDEEGNALWFWADEDGDPIDDDGLLITYWQPIPPPPVSASPQ